MKLEIGRDVYAFPEEVGLLRSCVVMAHGLPLALCLIDLYHMARLRSDEKTRGKRGVPHYLAEDLVEQRFYVWPEPDEDYGLFVRYYPPLKEF